MQIDMKSVNRDWIISLLTAFGLHGIVLFGFGLAFTQPAEFGMEIGKNSLEVNLVAAPLEIQPVSEISKEKVPPIAQEPPKVEDIIVPEPVHEEPPQPSKSLEKTKIIAALEPSKISGDGSSPHPGSDQSTLRSERGVETESKPSYLKNPPPPYPETARKLGQEGLVLLTVEVNTEGIPAFVKVKESSGFQTLDNAALKAIQKWRFSPASIGSLPVASQVDIPIRFQIQDKN